MHRIDVTPTQIDLFGLEVEIIRRCSAEDVQVIVGRHEDQGHAVLIRNGDNVTALVDEAAVFEMQRGSNTRPTEDAVPARALRAGKTC